MPDTSPLLDLPFLQPAQAQKHVTHNEALRRLDLVVQLTVAAIGSEAPPGAPSEGEVHALGQAPVSVWTGQASRLAAWLDGAWHFFDPRPGWRAWDQDARKLRVWDGNAWIEPPVSTQNLDGVGIATSSDATNRFSVRSPATLFSHEGAGHQIKVNKATDGDTASLVFQSNWTGHAEVGLAGNTALSIKVSPDGNTWTEALRLDPITGAAGGAAVQVSAADVTPGRLMRADFGYGPGNILGLVSESGGLPTGAVIESGSNSDGDYVRFADGTQICSVRLGPVSCTMPQGSLFASDSALTWQFPVKFADGTVPAVSGTGGAAMRFLGADASTNVQVSCRILSAVSDVAAHAPTVIAIGRWF
ncbi:DUF2793 domain-containing protein [Ruegeria sediminis]|uniref:DUF2793 domain-containing protein n=1 Tax=Ruegeria sediminis TaxID=2583820 RepID=A0ABY2WWV0_9RHOB|nr:DUF2793 domain-containing protein [Ruegeria sediminis]TMV07242.1 DUF2793 domain-containing protein [Ruegeria sediminis]